jgi:hypothetical protein
MAPALELIFLPPSRPDSGEVPYLVCRYVQRVGGDYDFTGAQDRTMPVAEYEAKMADRRTLAKLRKLITDPRLIQDKDQIAPIDPLPLKDAQELKETVLRRWREQHQAAGEAIDSISDEELWATIRVATTADLEWATIGEPFHMEELPKIAKDDFGITGG